MKAGTERSAARLFANAKLGRFVLFDSTQQAALDEISHLPFLQQILTKKGSHRPVNGR